MSHVNQEDGICYADGDEEYYVTGYVTVKVPVYFYTTAESGTVAFEDDLFDALDFREYEIMDEDLEIEIVRREE